MQPNWDERYKSPSYAYGEAPNVFFKECLDALGPGDILMPADGEGRNGVYAASQGWRVTAFDLSAEGRQKALLLAKKHQVAIDYHVGDFEHLAFPAASFDAVGLVYAHFPADKKSAFHQKLDKCLRPGGVVVFEAFGKQHLPFQAENPAVGGPKDMGMLFSTDELRADFGHYDIQLLEEQPVVLQEGRYHKGKGSVVRFVGKKP